MGRVVLAVPLALILAACTADVTVKIETTPSPAATASPVASRSPEPSASTLPAPTPSAPPANGVLVDLLSDSSTYMVSVVDSKGAVIGQVSAHQRKPIDSATGRGATLPYVSASATTLYYLDGDAVVKGWRLDGAPVASKSLDMSTGMEASFAVSPDDRTIAVTVLDFNRSPVHVTLYTDALGGGSRRVIFESDSDYVWPVAWHQGLLVLAHALGPFEGDITKEVGRVNPYSAISYHLVDPVNANRIFLMGSCTVSGPLSPAGSGCVQGGSIDWQGNTVPWSPRDWGQVSAAASLSPDGRWMMATSPDNPKAMALWRPDGTSPTFVDGPGPRDWTGWLDDQTIITGSYVDPSWRPIVVNIVSNSGGVEHPVAAHGFFAGLLPTNIG